MSLKIYVINDKALDLAERVGPLEARLRDFQTVFSEQVNPKDTEDPAFEAGMRARLAEDPTDAQAQFALQYLRELNMKRVMDRWPDFGILNGKWLAQQGISIDASSVQRLHAAAKDAFLTGRASPFLLTTGGALTVVGNRSSQRAYFPIGPGRTGESGYKEAWLSHLAKNLLEGQDDALEFVVPGKVEGPEASFNPTIAKYDTAGKLVGGLQFYLESHLRSDLQNIVERMKSGVSSDIDGWLHLVRTPDLVKDWKETETALDARPPLELFEKEYREYRDQGAKPVTSLPLMRFDAALNMGSSPAQALLPPQPPGTRTEVPIKLQSAAYFFGVDRGKPYIVELTPKSASSSTARYLLSSEAAGLVRSLLKYLRGPVFAEAGQTRRLIVEEIKDELTRFSKKLGRMPIKVIEGLPEDQWLGNAPSVRSVPLELMNAPVGALYAIPKVSELLKSKSPERDEADILGSMLKSVRLERKGGVEETRRRTDLPILPDPESGGLNDALKGALFTVYGPRPIPVPKSKGYLTYEYKPIYQSPFLPRSELQSIVKKVKAELDRSGEGPTDEMIEKGSTFFNSQYAVRKWLCDRNVAPLGMSFREYFKKAEADKDAKGPEAFFTIIGVALVDIKKLGKNYPSQPLDVGGGNGLFLFQMHFIRNKTGMPSVKAIDLPYSQEDKASGLVPIKFPSMSDAELLISALGSAEWSKTGTLQVASSARDPNTLKLLSFEAVKQGSEYRELLKNEKDRDGKRPVEDQKAPGELEAGAYGAVLNKHITGQSHMAKMSDAERAGAIGLLAHGGAEEAGRKVGKRYDPATDRVSGGTYRAQLGLSQHITKSGRFHPSIAAFAAKLAREIGAQAAPVKARRGEMVGLLSEDVVRSLEEHHIPVPIESDIGGQQRALLRLRDYAVPGRGEAAGEYRHRPSLGRLGTDVQKTPSADFASSKVTLQFGNVYPDTLVELAGIGFSSSNQTDAYSFDATGSPATVAAEFEHMLLLNQEFAQRGRVVNRGGGLLEISPLRGELNVMIRPPDSGITVEQAGYLERIARTNPKSPFGRPPRPPRRSVRNPKLSEAATEGAIRYADAPDKMPEDDRIRLAREIRGGTPGDKALDYTRIEALFPRKGRTKPDDWSYKARFETALPKYDLVERLMADFGQDPAREETDPTYDSAKEPLDQASYITKMAALSVDTAAEILKAQREKRRSPFTMQPSSALSRLGRGRRPRKYQPPGEALKLSEHGTVLWLSPEDSAPRVMVFRKGIWIDADQVPTKPWDNLGTILARALQSTILWTGSKKARQEKNSIWVGRVGGATVRLAWSPGNPLSLEKIKEILESPGTPKTPLYKKGAGAEGKKDKDRYLDALGSAGGGGLRSVSPPESPETNEPPVTDEGTTDF
jgi:hypothetical protein